MARTATVLIALVSMLAALAGCSGPFVEIRPDASDPLEEFVLEGEAKEKILILPVSGFISDRPEEGFFGAEPSVVQETVSHLDRAAADADVKAVVLKIDSPGGTSTASDILYREIADFKARRNVPVVAVLMDLATSGGYYIALPADRIVAHPTTITGSVGAIMVRPDLTGLMEKIGLAAEIDKSGDRKDMGAFYRETAPEEKEILQNIVETMGERFVGLVRNHRGLGGAALDEIASGRIYGAEEALKIGLVDRTGYVADALEEAKRLADAPQDAKVVVYRRKEYPDDNYYNPVTMAATGKIPGLPDFLGRRPAQLLAPGFYYLWIK